MTQACALHSRRRIVAGLAALPGAFCAGPSPAAEPRRIVTAGGDVSEIVYALGFGPRIVAADRASRHTPGSGKFAQLGPRRRLSPEGILALRPDLFIYAEDSGPPSALEIVRAAGVRSVVVPQKHTAAGVSEKIAVIGRTLDRQEAARRLAAQVAADFADTARVVAQVPKARRRRVLFTHSVTGGRLSGGAGGGTPADAIIALAGGVNAIASVQGYKPTSAESVAAAAPDVILMARRSDGTAATADEVFAVPSLAATPAGRTRRLVILEGVFLLGFGPRTTHAVRDLAQALYPELRFPPLRYA